MGVGGGYRQGARFPLSGLGGDLYDVGQLYGSYRGDALRAVASAGIAILEVPLENFVQKDLLVVGAAHRLHGPVGQWGLDAGLSRSVRL